MCLALVLSNVVFQLTANVLCCVRTELYILQVSQHPCHVDHFKEELIHLSLHLVGLSPFNQTFSFCLNKDLIVNQLQTSIKAKQHSELSVKNQQRKSLFTVNTKYIFFISSISLSVLSITTVYIYQFKAPEVCKGRVG